MENAPTRPGASAGAVIFNEHGQVLIVNPTYKSFWNLPGGRIDEGETPSAACGREIREELGLDLTVGDALVTAWVSHRGKGAHLYVIFATEVLTPEQQQAIRLQGSELSEHRFCLPEEIDRSLIPPFMIPVWEAALQAHAEKRQVYIEVQL